MIIMRTHEDPAARNGYLACGKLNTDSNGVGTFTVTGKDYASKIGAILLTCIQATASAVKNYTAYVVSIGAQSSGANLVTIQANQTIDSGSGTSDISAYDGDVYYMVWFEENTLPTDTTTNDTKIQEY